MPLTPNNFDHLPSARRSILHAIRSGREVDLYEGLDRILQHLSNIAERDDPETRAYYCAPQGHVTARGTVKLRELDRLYDPDYHPSPPPSLAVGTVEEREEATEEDLENGAVVDDDEDEEEEEVDELDSAMNARLKNADFLDEVDYKLSRLPDFRLSQAWLRDDGEEAVRYNSAVVEVKLCFEELAMKSKLSYRELVERAIDDMAPQVIEAVQVAFAEKPDQKEFVAIPTVNAFCRFVYFVRSTVPVLDPAMANQGKGFLDPLGVEGSKLYAKKRISNRVKSTSRRVVWYDMSWSDNSDSMARAKHEPDICHSIPANDRLLTGFRSISLTHLAAKSPEGVS
ncbi:hypothetical protein LXA43DRAFT_1098233 [Ganoderma leucocontextum]|nr:hypothetical protein LXA43DRAFT_1098233 [Ganoderma leucocontextum]